MASFVAWTKTNEAENYSESRPDYPKDVIDISLNYLRKHYDGKKKNYLGCRAILTPFCPF